MTSIRAMFFDVFGTLVDWRTGVAREADRALRPLGHTLDCSGFADAWRAEYQPGMEEVRSGRIPFCRLDVLHRHNLERFMPRFGLTDLSETVRHELTLAWHRLDAWPDVTAALKRLQKKFLLAPVSNGNISLMVDLARRNDFPWDAILGAEIAGDYKPKARVTLLPARRSISTGTMHDGGGAQQRSGRRGGLWFAHGAYCASRRVRSWYGERAPTVPVDFAAADLADLASKLGV